MTHLLSLYTHTYSHTQVDNAVIHITLLSTVNVYLNINKINIDVNLNINKCAVTSDSSDSIIKCVSICERE